MEFLLEKAAQALPTSISGREIITRLLQLYSVNFDYFLTFILGRSRIFR